MSSDVHGPSHFQNFLLYLKLQHSRPSPTM